MSDHDEMHKRAAALMSSNYDYLWIGPTVRSRLIEDIRTELHSARAPLLENIRDVLYCAVEYGDKPNHLYSCIQKLTGEYELDPKRREEIVRLMEVEYTRDRGLAPTVKL